MADEKRRRFDPSMLGVVGSMVNGLGQGVGAGIANKMNERTLLAAAALQGLLAADDSPAGYTPENVAEFVVAYADAVLKRLDEVPDPRNKTVPGTAP